MLAKELHPALALTEYSSIAAGVVAADAMAKRAPLAIIRSGTVQPGKYLVLIGGAVADVEESLKAGKEMASSQLVDFILLPHVHPQVVNAVGGDRIPEPTDAVGIIETSTVAAAISAADAGIKGAEVDLVEIRLADGLGGKGIVIFSGLVADVEAAVEIGVNSLASSSLLVFQVVIPQLDSDIWYNLSHATRFKGVVQR